MVTLKKSLTDWKEFNDFWLWQYTSRNAEYRKAYEHYIKDPIPQIVLEESKNIFKIQATVQDIRDLLQKRDNKKLITSCKLFKKMEHNNDWIFSVKVNKFFESTQTRKWHKKIIKPFSNIFHCNPKDPSKNSDSKKILCGALDSSLCKNNIGFHPLHFDELEFYEPESESFTYTVDMGKPLNQIIDEISCWYIICNASSTKEDRKEARLKLSKISIDTKSGFKVDDKIRAIGLALWDYKEIMSKGEKRKVSIREAATVLYKDFPLCAHDYDYPTREEKGLRKFERFYEHTSDCISKCMVRPLR